MHKYLTNLNLPVARVDSWGHAAQTGDHLNTHRFFPWGRLILSTHNNFDKLFITCNHGFPQAAIILMYFFAEDTSQFDPEFVRPYRAIIINNIKYTKLSPILYEQFALFKFAYLERNEITAEARDCRLVRTYFTDETPTDMIM